MVYYFYILFVFLSICFIFNFSSTVVLSVSARTLVTKLVYYNSIHSPIYNPNLTMLELSHLDLERSTARAAYLAQVTNNDQFQLTKLETDIVVRHAVFYAHLEVGSNLIDQYVILDTGSYMLWINCKPSKHTVPDPLFNPNESTTLQMQHYCDDTPNICDGNPTLSYSCELIDRCTYILYYGKGYSSGFLVSDTLRFGSDIVEDIVFGCSTNSNINRREFANGVLGLSRTPISFMGQMGAFRFGYCIGNLSDKHNEHNKLLIGNDIMLLGQITQLFIDGHYYISVEAISIGVTNLDIDINILRRNPNQKSGGMVVDSGSTYTFFPELVVDKFLDELYWIMASYTPRHGYRRTGSKGDYELTCYRGVISDVRAFPKVRLWLSLGAIMEFTAENMFTQYDTNTFCLAIVPIEQVGGDTSDISILGIFMQQTFYFVFDLQRQRLAFNRMDCAHL